MSWTLVLIIGLVFNGLGGPIEKPTVITVHGIKTESSCMAVISGFKRQYKNREYAVIGECVEVL